MKKHVLIVAPYFYPEGGGLERYAFWMAKALSRENRVTVLCMTRGEERTEQIEDFVVYRIRPEVIVSNTPLSLKFIIMAVQLVKDVDVVIAHTPVPFAADIASLLAKLRGLRIEVVYHTVGLVKGDRLLDLVSRVYSSIVERITLRGIDLVSVSRVVWQYLKERGYNSRIRYPPVVGKAQMWKFPQRKVVLFVGQLGKYHRFKNLDMLLKAFANVSNNLPELELWIVGEGDMKDEYIRLASHPGVCGKVKFFGRVTNAEKLREIYASSAILVLPSSFESFGMVVQEALASGTPVIVSKNVGSKILVDPGKNGIILNEISVESICNAISALFTNPKLLKKFSIVSFRSTKRLLSNSSFEFELGYCSF